MAEKRTSAAIGRRTVTTVLVIFMAVAVVAGCGLSKRGPKPRQDLSKVQLKQEIILFTFYRVPNLYSGLVRLNDEIVRIDKELERLIKIEDEFSRQKKIILSEQSNWNKIQKDLFAALSTIEKDIEEIYVTQLVNKAKGKELIDEKRQPLTTAINEALNASQPHTKRLKMVKKKTKMDTLKEKFFGKSPNRTPPT